jgi:hypothetical protein
VLKGGHPKSVNTALHTGPLGHTVCRCGRDERGTRSKPGDAEPQGIGAVSGWRFGRPQRQPSHSHFVIARAGRIAWCLRAQDRRGGQARERPSRRLACDRTRQGVGASARQNGIPGDGVPQGARNDRPRERRPTRNGAGAPALVVPPTSAGCRRRPGRCWCVPDMSCSPPAFVRVRTARRQWRRTGNPPS